jgi:hypothetical protein
VLDAMQDGAVAQALAQGLGEEAARTAGMLARGEAHATMAWQFAGLVFVGVLLSFLGTREPDTPRAPPRESIFGDFADTLKSSPFRLYGFIFFFDQIANGLTAPLVLSRDLRLGGSSGRPRDPADHRLPAPRSRHPPLVRLGHGRRRRSSRSAPYSPRLRCWAERWSRSSGSASPTRDSWEPESEAGRAG